MAKGIDKATPVTAAQAKSFASAGYAFAARYLVPPSYGWKRMTADEAKLITAAGMRIVSVYETTANRAASGADAGRDDGLAANAEALAVGQPKGTVIYFAVDYDAQSKDFDAIEAYLKAAAKQIAGYETGVYGSYAVVEEMAKRGACAHFWQTYAWSRGKRSDKANIFQYKIDTTVSGIPLDLNESYGNEGWWDTNPSKNPGTNPDTNPNTSPEHDEEEITMKPEDAEKIIKFLSAAWFAATTKTDKAEFNRLANEVRKAAGMPTE
ncbi:DUF1906 domain-containing protein [Cohnella ginsengisoli]|uniref:DUF1906 domain-containing protein n=1 Tax=Cohnella ginsengisoli TaxID=425004 RepID=A0A9X4KIT3_9BACL|nr:DUF1906 domain-containing protein [Cohnella ginsengisoli]MDG0792760.1 DUF1906 domain-containing protein [Cohnella ginsengisoli]